MGNCENLYLEIYDEVCRLKANEQFYKTIDNLSIDPRYKYKGMREKWQLAFNLIKRNG